MIISDLTAGLWLWALLSMAASIAGLYWQRREFWRAMWFMTGLWGVVDGVIAWFTFILPPLNINTLANVLFINVLLDVGYVIAGVWLLTRSRMLLRGFGLAILIQGFFLLGFDLFFWRRCLSVTA